MGRFVSIRKMSIRPVPPSRGPFRLVASKYHTFEVRSGAKLIGWTMETTNVSHEEALANARVFIGAMRKHN